MTVSLVKLTELHKQRIFVFLFGLFVISTVQSTCNPTLTFTGVPREEELLPITDMATRRSLTFNIKACGFVVLSLTNSSVLAGSVSRRISITVSTAGIWECKNQADCSLLGSANSYMTCNQTAYYWLYWNKTSLALHGSWTYFENWSYLLVTYTWATDLNIPYIIKPAGSDYFQGYFEAPFAERCCPSNSTKTDSKICTSEEQTSSTTAATTPSLSSSSSSSSSSSTTAATMKVEMTTESDTMSMTTDTTKLSTNVSTKAIANSTSTRKSAVAAEVTSVAAFSDVNETDDRATSTTSSSASLATAEGQKVTEGRSPDPSSTVARTWSSSASTPLNLGETTTPGSDTCGLPGNDVKQRLWCACRCLATTPRIFGNPNSLEANLTEEIEDTLRLPKKQLSAQIRAKTSAPDARPSSVSAGIVAVGIMSLIFFCLVAPDLLTLAQFLHGILKADRRLTTV